MKQLTAQRGVRFRKGKSKRETNKRVMAVFQSRDDAGLHRGILVGIE